MFLFSGSLSTRRKKRVDTQERSAWEALLEKVGQGLMVRTDSRSVQPGEVFVAVPGAAVDGARFIPDALARGAGYVVTAEPAEALPEEHRAKHVPHSRPALALGDLAAAFFHTKNLKLRLVGVTGTNGKTTTAYLLEHLLTAGGLKTGLMGTVAYRWPGFSLDARLTTPDCWTLHELLANMERSEVDAAVMEVSSHALDQHRVAGLRFDAAVFTNLSQDHLDYHHDMETYFRAKARLFTECPAPDKLAVINYDDPAGRRLLDMLPGAVGYGLTPAPDGVAALRGEILRHSVAGMTLRMTWGGRSWDLDTHLVGAHNAQNLLAAQAAALGLGLPQRELRKLADFTGVPGRLERVVNPFGLDIFVDYAHTPDALDKVQTALRELNPARLITVFGCGGNRDRAKRPLMAASVAKHADVAILTSDNPRHEPPLKIIEDAAPGLAGCPETHIEPDRAAALALAARLMQPGDVLLIAGKGHETYQQIGDERRHFNDVEVMSQALEENRR
ncbi:MAG: UDP-N-acetylmuramoyl-L-alanyl-D-glutamate--2,6-diaminopimelate ligase [Desulfovibrionaceae bacterium]